MLVVMTIAIDARELRTSTGRYIERLLHYLQQLDSDYDYTVLLKPEDIEGWQPSNPRFTKVACPHKEFTFAEQLGFLTQLSALEPDLVHFGMTQQPILYRGKSVTTIHDLTTVRFNNPDKSPLVFKLKQQVYKYVIRRVARKSAAIMTPSTYVKTDLVKFSRVSTEKIIVTYEAADKIADSPTLLPDLQNKEYIMYVGRPTPHKNLWRLVEAFANLQIERPALRLVLAGKLDANYERIRKEVQHRGLEGVVFTDFVSDGELRWLYENCAAYAFPSLSEGFGLPGLEAMQHGAPVVSSNASCLPEVYGNAAHYFNPLDITDMATKLADVLDSPTLRQELVAQGALQAASYSWQRMAEQTLGVYNDVLGS
jgi:glycosyltransferase involved in cell wall biosynthesis